MGGIFHTTAVDGTALNLPIMLYILHQKETTPQTTNQSAHVCVGSTFTSSGSLTGVKHIAYILWIAQFPQMAEKI